VHSVDGIVVLFTTFVLSIYKPVASPATGNARTRNGATSMRRFRSIDNDTRAGFRRWGVAGHDQFGDQCDLAVSRSFVAPEWSLAADRLPGPARDMRPH
jgi:hypothetical protein